MSLQINNYLSTVGSIPSPINTALIFCNGADTPKEIAIKSAEQISYALSNQVVLCFYNPMHSTSLIPARLKQPVEPKDDEVQKISKLFTSVIKHEIQTRTQTGCEQTSLRICLFLHSYGTVIAMNALQGLDPRMRDRIEIYSFGAAKMVPNNAARFVVNYVHDNDQIAEGTNIMEHDYALLHLKEIHQKEQLGTHRFETIFDKAVGDLFRDLNPDRETYSYESMQQKEEKNRRYYQLFLQPDPRKRIQSLLGDPLFQERSSYYSSLLIDYTIVIAPGISQKPAQVDSFEAYCQHHLQDKYSANFKNHLFKNYTHVLEGLKHRFGNAVSLSQMKGKL